MMKPLEIMPTPAGESQLRLRPWTRTARWARRVIFAQLAIIAGLLSTGLGFAYAANMADWFTESVLEAAVVVGFVTLLVGMVGVALLSAVRRVSVGVWIIGTLLPLVYGAYAYVYWTGRHGAEVAEYGTWHLLPLFATLEAVVGTALVGFIWGILVLVGCWGMRLARRSRRS